MKFLQLQINCLSLCGYTFNLNGKYDRPLTRIFALINWSLLGVIMVSEVKYVWDNLTDIQLMTDALCPLITGILALIKLMSIYFNRKLFYRFVKDVNRLSERVTVSAEKKYLEEGLIIDLRLAYFYGASAIGVGMLYMFFPIVMGVYELRTVGNTTWIMPLKSSFPYDISNPIAYILTYTWFFYSTILVIFGSVGIDTLFYGCAFHLAGHFRIVQSKFAGLNRINRINFRQHITYHAEILRLCSVMNDLYRPILLGQFVLSSVQICVIGYQFITPGQDTLYLIVFSMFLMAIFFQIFIFCHSGSHLKDESQAVSDGLYSSEWYSFDRTYRRLVILSMMRSQRYVLIRSGFYEANLETFAEILRTAGSYITLLKSMVEQKI